MICIQPVGGNHCSVLLWWLDEDFMQALLLVNGAKKFPKQCWKCVRSGPSVLYYSDTYMLHGLWLRSVSLKVSGLMTHHLSLCSLLSWFCNGHVALERANQTMLVSAFTNQVVWGTFHRFNDWSKERKQHSFPHFSLSLVTATFLLCLKVA